jgi:hypothetical protein
VERLGTGMEISVAAVGQLNYMDSGECNHCCCSESSRHIWVAVAAAEAGADWIGLALDPAAEHASLPERSHTRKSWRRVGLVSPLDALVSESGSAVDDADWK